ncbi:ribosome maturation factor, partial [Francisella tularensis subsp. holarctica]|nr:ribosome maturation factor [Francisella tularensis subsp. holarctica]
APDGSQTKFKGVLERVEGYNSNLNLVDGKEISFDFDELNKLRVSPDFS